MSDLWTAASRDMDGEGLRAAVTAARVGVQPVWAFLIGASDDGEFETRKAIAAEHIEAAVAEAVGNNEGLTERVRNEVTAVLDDEFATIQATRIVNHETSARASVEATLQSSLQTESEVRVTDIDTRVAYANYTIQCLKEGTHPKSQAEWEASGKQGSLSGRADPFVSEADRNTEASAHTAAEGQERAARVSGNATLEQVQNYMPSNYRASERDGVIWISGRDSAGWTLDGYVIPRLASGLISAEEVSSEGQGETWASVHTAAAPTLPLAEPCAECGHPRSLHNEEREPEGHHGCSHCDCPGWTNQEDFDRSTKASVHTAQTFRVKHNFDVYQPRRWQGTDYERTFGSGNEGVEVEASSAEEAKAKFASEHRHNPFYLKVESASRHTYRIVPSEKAGYGPGRHVVQKKYYPSGPGQGHVWADIGDPEETREKAEAKLTEHKTISERQDQEDARKKGSLSVEALNPFEQWMVKQNIAYAQTEGASVVVNRLRDGGYDRVADAVAEAFGDQGRSASLHEAIRHYTHEELSKYPTQSQGQTDDLKLDTGEHRYWLSRMTREDGEPYEHTVHVERHNDRNGGWEHHESYDGDNPSRRASLHEALGDENDINVDPWDDSTFVTNYNDPPDARIPIEVRPVEGRLNVEAVRGTHVVIDNMDGMTFWADESGRTFDRKRAFEFARKRNAGLKSGRPRHTVHELGVGIEPEHPKDASLHEADRDRATRPRHGDQTACKICGTDIEYHGKPGKREHPSVPGLMFDSGGWVDRGGNRGGTHTTYDEDGMPTKHPGHEHQPYSDRIAAYNPFNDPNNPYVNPLSDADKAKNKRWRDVFPDGVPLHGDLTEEQERELKRHGGLQAEGVGEYDELGRHMQNQINDMHEKGITNKSQPAILPCSHCGADAEFDRLYASWPGPHANYRCTVCHKETHYKPGYQGEEEKTKPDPDQGKMFGSLRESERVTLGAAEKPHGYVGGGDDWQPYVNVEKDHPAEPHSQMGNVGWCKHCGESILRNAGPHGYTDNDTWSHTRSPKTSARGTTAAKWYVHHHDKSSGGPGVASVHKHDRDPELSDPGMEGVGFVTGPFNARHKANEFANYFNSTPGKQNYAALGSDTEHDIPEEHTDEAYERAYGEHKEDQRWREEQRRKGVLGHESDQPHGAHSDDGKHGDGSPGGAQPPQDGAQQPPPDQAQQQAPGEQSGQLQQGQQVNVHYVMPDGTKGDCPATVQSSDGQQAVLTYENGTFSVTQQNGAWTDSQGATFTFDEGGSDTPPDDGGGGGKQKPPWAKDAPAKGSGEKPDKKESPDKKEGSLQGTGRTAGRMSERSGACAEGDHKACRMEHGPGSEQCSCPYHGVNTKPNKGRRHYSGACAAGDHGDCKMPHGNGPEQCACPFGTHHTSSLQHEAIKPGPGWGEYECPTCGEKVWKSDSSEELRDKSSLSPHVHGKESSLHEADGGANPYMPGNNPYDTGMGQKTGPAAPHPEQDNNYSGPAANTTPMTTKPRQMPSGGQAPQPMAPEPRSNPNAGSQVNMATSSLQQAREAVAVAIQVGEE